MKILFLGSCQSVFLSPLTAKLKELAPSIKISAANLINLGSDTKSREKELFDDLIEIQHYKNNEQFKFSFQNLTHSLKAYIQLTSAITLIRNLLLFRWKSICQLGWHKHRREFTKNHNKKLIQGYDFLSIQNLTKSNLRFLDYADPSKQKILLSFWGSDLMRVSKLSHIKEQKKALEVCHGITVQSESLKFLICAKFGWELKDKIFCTPMVADQEIFGTIDSFSNAEAKDSLSDKFSLNTSKTWVTIGYQTSPEMHALATLKELCTKLPQETLNRLSIIFPRTYKDVDQSYLDEIHHLCRTYSLENTHISSYLEVIELAALRKATDIYLHFPISDAYSLTLLEHLYGGGKVISGSWLPYNHMRAAEFDYHEIENVSKVSDVFSKIIDIDVEKENRERVINLLDPDRIIINWLNIFNTIAAN